jgi:hypothetical protein
VQHLITDNTDAEKLGKVSNSLMLGIDNTGCISRRDNSIFLDGDRLIATEEG